MYRSMWGRVCVFGCVVRECVLVCMSVYVGEKVCVWVCAWVCVLVFMCVSMGKIVVSVSVYMRESVSGCVSMCVWACMYGDRGHCRCSSQHCSHFSLCLPSFPSIRFLSLLSIKSLPTHKANASLSELSPGLSRLQCTCRRMALFSQFGLLGTFFIIVWNSASHCSSGLTVACCDPLPTRASSAFWLEPGTFTAGLAFDC